MVEKLLEDPSKIGALVFAMIAVAALGRRWVIPYDTHREIVEGLEGQIVNLKAERDKYLDFAMSAVRVAEGTQKVRGGGFVGRKESP